MSISIVIVSWNACGYLRDCLTSIRKTRGAAVVQMIVVDNASSDGSPEMVEAEFPEVELVRSTENLGFAKANNLGIQRSTGSLIALVNSDVVVHPECFQRLGAFLGNHPEVGLAGPKVFGRDGCVQMTYGKLPTVWNTICEFLLLFKIFPGWSTFSGYQDRRLDGGSHAAVEVPQRMFLDGQAFRGGRCGRA